MLVLTTYSIYLVLSIGFTYWVGRNLYINGRIFLLESFDNSETKADSVNRLLLVGFYLVNFGIVSLFLSVGTKPDTTIQSIEYLTLKFGVVLVVLGAMHFFNMRNISNMSSKAQKRRALAKAGHHNHL